MLQLKQAAKIGVRDRTETQALEEIRLTQSAIAPATSIFIISNSAIVKTIITVYIRRA